MKRKSMSRSKSKKSFSNGAKNIHPFNAKPTPMRGGIRL